MPTPQGVDATRGVEKFSAQVLNDESRPKSSTWEKPRPDRTGVEIWVRGVRLAGRRRISSPYGMIPSVRGPSDRGRSMTSDPTDWHQVLARVSGQLVRGEQRVTTHELLTVHLGVPVTD